jgi:hypothetical protein
LAIVFLKAISISLSGYKSALTLILGLIKICSANFTFRDRISDEFQEKDGKALLKNIKNWIKDVSSNLNNLVRSGKMGFWRKPD